MKVKLRNPDRVVEMNGPKTVRALLSELQIVPEAVLVIRAATLLTRDESLSEADELEVRPVLSGGSTGGCGGAGSERLRERTPPPERGERAGGAQPVAERKQI